MITKLFTLLTNAGPDAQLDEPDAQIAMAAILVAAARSDGSYDAAERAMISRILSQRYGLNVSEASALRERAELTDQQSSDLVRFTRAIKMAVPHEERVSVIEAVWEIAYADGQRSDEESSLVRRLAGLLYIEDKDAGLARQRVEARLGIA